MNRSIQVLEVRSELGAGTRGASLGIGAMKVASLNRRSKYFAKNPLVTIPNENELLFWESQFQHAKYIDGVTKVYDYVMSEVAGQLTNKQNFVIVLAGDHSTAGGTIAGIKKAYPDKRLGVVWIDAHADMHTPYTTPSGNVHGMPLAISLGMDNLAQKRNEVNPLVSDYWEQLKNIGGICPKLNKEDVVFIGVRDTEPEEDYLLESNNIRNISVDEVRQKGVDAIVKESLAYLDDCDLIYVSFDVDSMDCFLVSHGTGTPVPNGLAKEEAAELLTGLVQDPKVCCFEITEVNPTLDEKCNEMAETAFTMLELVTNAITKAEASA